VDFKIRSPVWSHLLPNPDSFGVGVIPVLGSQSAGDVSHKPGGRLPQLSARPAVTPRNPACLVNITEFQEPYDIFGVGVDIRPVTH